MKRHKKIEDRVLKELDEKMHVDLDYQDIIKNVDLSKYSSCEKPKKKIGFWLGGAGALTFCSILLIAGIVISQNQKNTNNVNKTDNASSLGQNIEGNSNLPAPSTGVNALELEFMNLSLDSEIAPDLNMYEVFYDTNGNWRQDVSIYEINVSLKSSPAVAVYIEEEGIKEVFKNYQSDYHLSTQNIIDGSLLEYFYIKDYNLSFKTKWMGIDIEKPISLYSGNLRLAGLYVFDNVTITKEILNSKQIKESYDFYRSVSLNIDDAKNGYFTNVSYKKDEQVLWCTAVGEVNLNANYFNNLTNKINYSLPLADIKDNLITVEAIENFDFEKQAESCLKSSEGNYNTYEYDKYCLCLREYYAKKGKVK